MPPIVLDTSVSISFWRQQRAKNAKQKLTEKDARTWARKLIQLQNDAIVSPVAIEFLSGSRNRDELRLFRAFIGEFNVIDRGAIPATDWEKARQQAERVPRDGRPRQLGDCLIRAIATRLHHEVFSLDAGI